MLTVGSLFAGIGGFDLGFERAGMRVVWQCEQNDYCRRVLARHWPGVPCYPDVRALVGHGDSAPKDAHAAQGSPRPAASESGGGLVVPVPVPYVDVLCGGFPCQDLSYAGKGAGIDGERSGLWREFARLIGELRPRYVVIENVPALASRGLDRVLADLAACGLDAEWDHLPASAFGAPHRRDRVWVVAYAAGDDGGPGRAGRPASSGAGEPVPVGAFQDADADRGRLQERPQLNGEPLEGTADGHPRRGHADGLRDEVADAQGATIRAGLRESEPRGIGRGRPGDGGGPWNAWATEPDVGRVANGIPARVDRLAALGNALVPQIAQWIGERILEYEEGRLAA